MTNNKSEGNDRLYINPTEEPLLVIKTNLDPSDNKEENPYYTNKRDKKFEQYFKRS